jgi:hypothetical protein
MNDDMRSHWWVVIKVSVLIVWGAVVVAACGSGATEGPDDDPTGVTAGERAGTGRPGGTGSDSGDVETPGGTGGTDGDAGPPGGTGGDSGDVDGAGETDGTGGDVEVPEEEYSWGLPSGDPGVDPFGNAVYLELRSSCAAGQSWLDENWRESPSPQTVLLFQAAVVVCAGERESGRRMFAEAEARYGGWPGIGDFPSVCEVFKAVVSVLEQVAPATVACPDGDQPPWTPGGPNGDCLDDPRTPEDECTTASTDTTTIESTQPAPASTGGLTEAAIPANVASPGTTGG